MSIDSTPCVPFRYVVIFLTCFATFAEYLTRVNLNIAIVSMVQQDLNDTENAGVISNTCPFPGDPDALISNTSSTHDEAGNWAEKFYWSPSTQGILLGAFFYGYVLLQIPGGRLAEIFGGKWIIAFGIIFSGVINLITPLVVESLILFTTSRVVLGLVQGVVFPACFALVYQWLPVRERSTGFALLNVGSNIGSVVATAMTGYLSEHGFAGGWPSAFIISGIIALIWFILWSFLVKSKPSDHWMVSSQELEYIKENSQEGLEGVSQANLSVPWVAIMTSRPVLALIFARFCGSWGYTALQTKFPAYLHDVLHTSITENGLLNAILYLSVCLSLIFGGYVSEVIISKDYMSRTKCRKLFETIGLIGSAVCLALVPLTGCSQTMVMVLLVVGYLTMGIVSGGDIAIVAEMTTNFPATVYSLANMVSMATGIICPYVVGLILESAETPEELRPKWDIVFYLAAVINVLGAIVFAAFASASVQPWDYPVKQCSDDLGETNTIQAHDDSERLLKAPKKQYASLISSGAFNHLA